MRSGGVAAVGAAGGGTEEVAEPGLHLQLLEQVDGLLGRLTELEVSGLTTGHLHLYLRRCSEVKDRTEYLSGRAVAALDPGGSVTP